MALDDVLVLPLDMVKFDTHSSAVDKVIKKFGKVSGYMYRLLCIVGTLYEKHDLRNTESKSLAVKALSKHKS